MRDRATLTADPIDQQQSSMDIQPSVTVVHEDLRTVKTTHLHRTRRSSLRQQPTHVTNVLAEYS